MTKHPKQGNRLILRAFQLAGVASLFAINGAWSYWYCTRDSSNYLFLFPIPFCTLSLLLFLRKPAGLLAAAGMYLVWLFSYLITVLASIFSRLPIIESFGATYAMPFAIGGAVGGLGLALATAVVHDQLFSWRLLLGAVVVGAIFALPFGDWLASDPNLGQSGISSVLPQRQLEYAFAVWQAAMGTYLYAVTRQEWRRLGPDRLSNSARYGS
jgi:hypothetical protein